MEYDLTQVADNIQCIEDIMKDKYFELGGGYSELEQIKEQAMESLIDDIAWILKTNGFKKLVDSYEDLEVDDIFEAVEKAVEISF